MSTKRLALLVLLFQSALYLRVSTDEQTTDNQRPELEVLARDCEAACSRVPPCTTFSPRTRRGRGRLTRPESGKKRLLRNDLFRAT